ncbi:MAG: hypothetical protein K1X94_17160 [Sandaracinaceae bacterium]|nr:hypothetical protein [Sandaracinaceae bacterium]
MTAIDEVVVADRLVTLEEGACDAARPFDAGECATLVFRDLASGAVTARTPVPIRIRGLVSLERFDVDGAGHGLLLRAYDHACFVSESGRIEATFDVPPSTLEEGVGLEQVQGAMVFERGGCHAYVVGRSDLGHGRHLHGIESHIYSDLSQPHDTVCFGFRVRPLGELRVGTRPAGRGRHGERRHAIAARVLVAVMGSETPVVTHAPTLLAFDARGVAMQVVVGNDGEVIESATLEGRHAVIVVTDGTTHRRVELDAMTGRRLSVVAVPDPSLATQGAQGSAPATPLQYDRHGIIVPRFARCSVLDDDASRTHRVRFDEIELFRSARPTLVLDQRGERCVVVETGGGPERDVVHLVTF